jgi:hypothetical protein
VYKNKLELGGRAGIRVKKQIWKNFNFCEALILPIIKVPFELSSDPDVIKV